MIKKLDELPYLLGMLYFGLWIVFVLAGAVCSYSQTVGEAWIESITPPVSFPNYEDVGDTARRYTFQDTQYVTIPNIHTVLPATEVRGASGYVSFVDGNNETSLIWVAGSVGSVSSMVPYVLIGSVTAQLEWVAAFEASDLGLSEGDVSEIAVEEIEERQIYQAHGTLTEDTRQWRYQLDAGIQVDRDWKPFGAKFGGHWFIPGIEPGNSPGTDGALFIITPNDDLLSGINWELLYKVSTVTVIEVSAGEETHTLPAMRMETLRGL